MPHLLMNSPLSVVKKIGARGFSGSFAARRSEPQALFATIAAPPSRMNYWLACGRRSPIRTSCSIAYQMKRSRFFECFIIAKTLKRSATDRLPGWIWMCGADLHGSSISFVFSRPGRGYRLASRTSRRTRCYQEVLPFQQSSRAPRSADTLECRDSPDFLEGESQTRFTCGQADSKYTMRSKFACGQVSSDWSI